MAASTANGSEGLWRHLSPAIDSVELARHAATHRRGWVVRRALLVADILGLLLAFGVAEATFGRHDSPGLVPNPTAFEYLAFALTIPLWVVMAKLYGLYDRDEERADHSTVDDLVGVFHLVTTGAWFVFVTAWLTKIAQPNLPKIVTFWGLAIALVTVGRVVARTVCRQRASYVQNTVIVGAGNVGQLIARKLSQHPEYGIRVVGFIDADPRVRHVDVPDLPVLGTLADLAEVVRLTDAERVVIAFSHEPHDRLLEAIRPLRDNGVQIDLVPRLFEAVGPRLQVHTVEGVPLLGLPPVRLSPSSRVLKRAVDIAVSVTTLVLVAPLFGYIALRIKLDSSGPVFFRQRRLGIGMKEFTVLKFRTMSVDADETVHRDYISRSMKADPGLQTGGLYKLDRSDVVTPVGHWLRRTSLDELPQLINVARGDMSLVGPRPCIPYETEGFEEYHFDRFLVPQGITGLWQVTARARSTFAEALDMDVSYAHDWSFWLDIKLLLRTPLAVLQQRGVA